ncbi:MLP-like protein 423 [Hibiscus trionum]|uniref:MLP-like protein 423 n=1 Tax=Hibiscus trionum TaxID=183268 RepID=A0A9W7HMI7_HIBTR|nr:MLP-like protein 423 [Hibiscus trionum]
MGVTSYSDEYTSTIPPARLFKALIVDSHNLIPKLMPLAIKSIEITGDGGAGSTRQINFAEGNQVKYMKNRVDELDEKNFSFKYSMIEGNGTMDKLEKITYEVKFETTPDGGSKSKMTSTYYTKGDFELTEEEVKAGKEKALAMYKAVEGYLLQNPEAYIS